MNLPSLSILQAHNPVVFDGVMGSLIPSNSMELELPSMSVTVLTKFKLHSSPLAAGVNLEGLGYGK